MFWSTFSVWGSVLFGAVLTVWLTTWHEHRKTESEREAFRKVLEVQLHQTLAQPLPDYQNANFPTWPDRGCAIVPVILGRNIFTRAHEIELVASLGQLQATVATYNSYRHITASLISGSLGGASFDANVKAAHTMMHAHFQNVSIAAMEVLAATEPGHRTSRLHSLFRRRTQVAK